jgi:hypothetical protein
MLCKRILFFWCLVLNVLVAHAQDYQKEINDQVWKPFIESFNNLNAELFLSVHSKDLTRSPRDSKQILNWNEYLSDQKKQMSIMKGDGLKLAIELHFTERIANGRQAIDVGIYKTTVILKDGTSNSGYGRFHVVMRKENGVWKILVDTDSSEGHTIEENDFLAAKPM